ncbi:MAG: hypothetical protein V1755_15140 [Chloroflexota bacterium]
MKAGLYWSVVAAVAALVFIQFCRVSGVGGHGPAKIERLLTGRADRPYAYRALLPVTANLLAPLLDQRIALRIGAMSETIMGEGFFLRRLNGSEFPSQVVLILAMMYLSLVGFAAVISGLLRDFGYLRWVQYLGPVVALLGATLFMRFGYIYDFSALYLFALGSLLMYRRRWWQYVFVLAAGTANKETAIFLCLIFVLYYSRRLTRPHFAALLAIQLMTYGSIQGIVRYATRHNPGQPAQWHLADQFGTLMRSTASVPYGTALTAAGLLSIAALVAYRWRDKPEFLRVGMAILPLFLGLFLIWGYPYEIRVLLEVYPIVGILVLPPRLIRQPAPPNGGARGSTMSPPVPPANRAEFSAVRLPDAAAD